MVAGFEIGPESSTPEYDNATGVPTLLSPTLQPFAGTIYPRARGQHDGLHRRRLRHRHGGDRRHLELTGGIRYDSFHSDYEAQFYRFRRPLSACRRPTHPTTAPTKPRAIGPGSSTNPRRRPASISTIRPRSIRRPNRCPRSWRCDPSTRATLIFLRKRTGSSKPAPRRKSFKTASCCRRRFSARRSTTPAFPDPLNPGFNTLGGDQRVDGVEVEAVGRLTARWQINASYTNLHSQVIKSAPGGPAVGIGLFNAPDNAFALFTTYQLTDRLEVGGGMIWCRADMAKTRRRSNWRPATRPAT